VGGRGVPSESRSAASSASSSRRRSYRERCPAASPRRLPALARLCCRHAALAWSFTLAGWMGGRHVPDVSYDYPAREVVGGAAAHCAYWVVAPERAEVREFTVRVEVTFGDPAARRDCRRGCSARDSLEGFFDNLGLYRLCHAVILQAVDLVSAGRSVAAPRPSGR